MSNNIYLLALAEARNYTDRDAYVSDLALSSAWGDEEGAEIPQERLEWLGQLWDAVHRSYKDVAAAAGMSQRELARHFCVPYKTIEGWQSGRHEPPRYVLLLMQENLGLLRREV